MDILEKSLFPFSKSRDEQERMLADVIENLKEGGNLLCHAPTGIGKTAASIPAALAYALENGKTVFFLTPKHSQHHIAIETVKKVAKRHKKNIVALDIIGKQWTCPYEGARDVSSGEFNNFCRAHRKHETCRFYNKIHEPGAKAMLPEAKRAIKKIKEKGALHSEELAAICKEWELCPYELAMNIGRSANIVICDYYHIFQPSVRMAILNKMDKSLEDIILIVDEAHNLPERVRSLMSKTLSEYSISGAIKEAKGLREENLEGDMEALLSVMKRIGESLKEREMFLRKEKLTKEIEGAVRMDISPFLEDLEGFGETILELPNRHRSFCASIASFLAEWVDKKEESTYARIFNTYRSYSGKRYQLAMKCLDPAVYTEDVFSLAHASILMSGTFLPLEMYEDVLGIKNAKLKQYKNPFPDENRIVLVTEGITTKFSKRSDSMWEKIARTLADMVSEVPGNAAIFFPSYRILENIANIMTFEGKEILLEKQDMKKKERHTLYKRLSELSKGKGGILFAVQAGSFSEGMDFPGRMLDLVAVVGLPLERPSLETDALIKYYDAKFGRGWDYGYIYPAMNRALQAAGRCIRSESDRGVIVLMDERFKWKNYRKCLPKDVHLISTAKPDVYIRTFFKQTS